MSRKRKRTPKRPLSTSKFLIYFLFVNCTIIELFTMLVTWKQFSLAETIGLSIDFNPLTTLIGSVVGEIIGFAVYCAKAAKENSQGGITYDSIMRQ